jgi:hypothetical protein
MSRASLKHTRITLGRKQKSATCREVLERAQKISREKRTNPKGIKNCQQNNAFGNKTLSRRVKCSESIGKTIRKPRQ